MIKKCVKHEDCQENFREINFPDQEIDFQPPLKQPKICIIQDQHLSIDQKVIQDLTNSIQKLTKDNEKLHKDLKRSAHDGLIWRNKYLTVNLKLTKILTGLKNHFSDSQVDSLMGKKIRNWDNNSKRKSILIKQKAGDRNLNLIRKLGFPLPSLSSVKRTLKPLDFKPGILNFNIEVLKHEFEQLSSESKNVVIGFDGKHIVPGFKDGFGKATIEPSSNNAKKNPQKIASQTLVFLLMGLNPRIKRIVDYEFITDSCDGKTMLEKTLEVVSESEIQINVKVRGLVFDLGCDNIAMMKLLGIDFNMKSFNFFIPHPCDSERKLYFFPDLVHGLKNITCAIRIHALVFSDSIVRNENLSSHKTNYKDILDIFDAQKRDDVKFTKKLTISVVKPKHYQKMREVNAYELFSSEVIHALEITKSRSDKKKNPIAFFLNLMLRLKNIIFSEEGWSKNNWKDYENDINFLKYMAYDILPNVNFEMERGYVKSLKGMIIAIRSLICLSGEIFDENCEGFHPKHITNNATENQFSQLTHHSSLKPDCRDVRNSIRAMSISAASEGAVRGSNYSFDGNDISNFDPVDVIQEVTKKKESTIDHSINLKLIEVPSTIHESTLFKSYLNRFGFHRDIGYLINSNKNIFDSCKICQQQMKLIADGAEHSTLSQTALKFFAELEALFQQLQKIFPITHESFKENFLFNASSKHHSIHCNNIQESLIIKYLQYRTKLASNTRDASSVNKFGSRGLSNAV